MPPSLAVAVAAAQCSDCDKDGRRAAFSEAPRVAGLAGRGAGIVLHRPARWAEKESKQHQGGIYPLGVVLI